MKVLINHEGYHESLVAPVMDESFVATFLATEYSLDLFLAHFRAGTLAKETFTHSAHLAMAACYCRRFAEEECQARARTDIRRFNEAKGGANTEDAGYHETITVFWLNTVRAFLRERCLGASRLEATRATVKAFGDRRGMFKEFYSFDVLNSREARARYIEPDRKPDAAAPAQMPG